MLNEELLSTWSSLPQGTVLFPVEPARDSRKSKHRKLLNLQAFRSWTFHVLQLKTKSNDYPPTEFSEISISCEDCSERLEIDKDDASNQTLILTPSTILSPIHSSKQAQTANMAESLETAAAVDSTKTINRTWSTVFSQIGFNMKKTIDVNATALKQLKSTFSLQNSLSSLSIVRRKKSRISFVGQAKEHIKALKPCDMLMTRSKRDEVKDGNRPVNMIDNSEGCQKLNLTSRQRASTIVECDESFWTEANEEANSQQLTAKGRFQKVDECRVKRFSYWDSYSSQTQQYAQICTAINEVSMEYQSLFEAESKSKCTSWFSSIDNPYFKTSAWAENDTASSFCSLDSSSTITFDAQFSQVSFDLDNASDYVAAIKYDSSFDLQWQETFHRVKNRASKIIDLLDKFSWALHELLNLGHSTEAYAYMDIYNDSSFDLNSYTISLRPATSWLDIYSHFYSIFQCGQFTGEHIVYVFFFVTRMLQTSKKIISDLNWRLISTAALLTAAKILDDCSIFNADFMTILPEFCMVDMNAIEKAFLMDIQWNLNLRCHEFAAAYFYLNSQEFVR